MLITKLINQVRSGQVRSGKVRLGQVRSGQVRSDQIRSDQIRSDQTCLIINLSPATKVNQSINRPQPTSQSIPNPPPKPPVTSCHQGCLRVRNDSQTNQKNMG